MIKDTNTDRLRLLALNLTRKVGPHAAASRLYRKFGRGGTTLFAKAVRVDPLAPPEWPRLPPGVDDGPITEKELEMAKQELNLMEKADVSLTTWLDDDFPVNLRHILCPPPVLYRRGKLVKNDWMAVAVVGTRKASPEYIEFAYRLGYQLAQAGITVISGLARGIDRAAHEGALAADGRTIAILGTGADVCYPNNHRPLAERIARQGALLTYFPMGTPPLAHHFPARNWILAGMALITVVVQCGLKSGALITAHFAASQGRDVMAVPGHVDSKLSEGCNELIKDGVGVVTSPRDVLSALQHDLSFFGFFPELEQTQDTKHLSLSQRILDAIDAEHLDADGISRYVGEGVDVVQSQLLRMELAGQVISLPGGRYRRRGKTGQ